MDILGSIGKLYTFILLVLLFLGSGLAVWAGINSIINKKDKIKENTNKIRSNLSSSFSSKKNHNIIGGNNMKNNGFIKLAVFSLVGIIISAAILTALPSITGSSMNNMNMTSQYNNSAMNMQYNQSGMLGMSGYGMQGNMNTNTDLYYIQQQLNSMQQQLNQLQNQMNSSSMSGMQSNTGSGMNNSSGMNNNNNTNGNSNSNSNSSMSSMPMM